MSTTTLAMGCEPFKSAAETLLAESGCTIRRLYKKGKTGSAYWDNDDWEITVPAPIDAESFQVFAHEVAHQLLHRKGCPGRNHATWLKELECEEYSLKCFERFGLPGRDEAVKTIRKHLAFRFVRSVRRSKNKLAKTMEIMERCPDELYDDAEFTRINAQYEEWVAEGRYNNW